MTNLGQVIQANIGEAKARLSDLVQRAELGEEVVIARGGRPAVRLVPVGSGRRTRRGGWLKGRIRVSPDFDGYDAQVERDYGITDR